MKIEHVAIWVSDLELLKDFYTEYFDLQCGDKYVNRKKGYTSYFLSAKEGARLELMHRVDITERNEGNREILGMAHIAFSVGSNEKVDQLTTRLQHDGYTIVGNPRTTGDGYYESVIADPEGNLIEITT